VDGVVVVNEVVELAKRTRKECLIFKVDFEKAYDSVEWGFLEYMLHRFGFCAKWIAWIRACTFAGNLSVLVNGSPTSEICIQRGLKQGDPLAPFLFLLVVEGFSGVMRRAVDLGIFKGFSFGRGEVVISHLQYADDTLCIGEASISNLWALKAILRGFEMASGLKVNFFKSGLLGVNVSSEFMASASTFLNCRLESIPFKYLGLPIGANPKSSATWDPLVEKMRKRLFSWRNKHISLRGRIVLINSVLNAIPVFFLSFMKMPKSVWKKLVRIQREFLWGGVRGGRKISWVKWSIVCQDKSQGGLGVRDARIFNLSLLAKWRWRLLQPGMTLWKRVLVARYGRHILSKVDWSEHRSPSSSSNWWKDICGLERIIVPNFWWSEAVVRVVGDGSSTSFWLSKWVGEAPLASVFPRLFSLSMHKEGLVNNFCEKIGEVWSWYFSLRRDLFQWELDLVDGLRNYLEPVRLSPEEDRWKWVPGSEGNFTVKSSYAYLANLIRSNEVVVGEAEEVFSHIWESSAPSKVIAFSWQLFYDRIPTRLNLDLRGILAPEVSLECVGCVGRLESASHLFLHCPKAMVVWYALFRWIGVVIVMPESIATCFEILRGAAKNKTLRQGFMLIWHAAIWSIWKARNNAIFANEVVNPYALVEEIKVVSWKWSLTRLKLKPCLFYEWVWDPGDCLSRKV
jgi:hypothetical protein